MKPHSKRVMGIAFLKKMGYLYSISEDGKFKVTEVHSGSVVNEITPGRSGLKNMIYKPDRGCFLVADGEGYVYVISAITVSVEFYN